MKTWAGVWGEVFCLFLVCLLGCFFHEGVWFVGLKRKKLDCEVNEILSYQSVTSSSKDRELTEAALNTRNNHWGCGGGKTANKLVSLGISLMRSSHEAGDDSPRFKWLVWIRSSDGLAASPERFFPKRKILCRDDLMNFTLQDVSRLLLFTSEVFSADTSVCRVSWG